MGSSSHCSKLSPRTFYCTDYNPGQKLLGKLRASLHFTPNSIILTIGCTLWEHSMLEEKSPSCFVENPTLIKEMGAISKVTLPTQHFCPGLQLPLGLRGWLSWRLSTVIRLD